MKQINRILKQLFHPNDIKYILKNSFTLGEAHVLGIHQVSFYENELKKYELDLKTKCFTKYLSMCQMDFLSESTFLLDLLTKKNLKTILSNNTNANGHI